MDTSNIILNISAESDKPTSYRKQSRKIFGSRRQRIKQRKSIKQSKFFDSKRKSGLLSNYSEYDSGLQSFSEEGDTKSPDALSSKVVPKKIKLKADNEKREKLKESAFDSQNKFDLESGTFAKSNVSKSNNRNLKNQQLNNKIAKLESSTDPSIYVARSVNNSGPNFIVSSLFKNNPNIPILQSENIESIKEDVFSKKCFSDMNLHEYLVKILEEKFSFTQMTCIQSKAIPKILKGKDVMLKSQTGSGKTLSYAVPIIEMLQSRTPHIQRSDGVFALVIVPTRELALQSFGVFHQLVHSFCWIVPGCLIGGEKRKAEKSRIRKGINVLIATPGRLIDHMEHTSCMMLSNVDYFVIDEADRLLDMGFERDVSKIVETLNKSDRRRQTILLSATLSEKVERLAGLTLINPQYVYMSKSKEVCLTEEDSQKSFALPPKLKQFYVIVPAKLRLVTLSAFILSKIKYNNIPMKMIIFLSTKDSVYFHSYLFTHIFNNIPRHDLNTVNGDDTDIDLFKLHGDMPQKERSQVYEEFCTIKSGVLLCTDVAARGLDLPAVSWIVQYTTPGAPNDYIHRVGRTARIGTKGNALLFLLPSEANYVKTLSEMQISINSTDMNNILKALQLYTSALPDHKFKKRERPRTLEEAATYLQMSFEQFVNNDVEAQDLAAKAFQSFVRSYATYPSELKSIFHVKALHLGHLAKSFALTEAPTKLTSLLHSSSQYSNNGRFSRCQKRKNNYDNNRKPMKRKATSSLLTISEFDSGLNFMDRTQL